MNTFPPTGRCALRKGRVSIPGHMYLLTTVARDRQRLFGHAETARTTCRVVHASTTWADARLLAWVLMPDHWHGLVQLGDEPLGRVMNRFKACVSRALYASSALQGRPWERSFHDHALRADDDVRAVARYLVGNPVRAGLVEHVLMYPYWNAIWLDRDESL